MRNDLQGAIKLSVGALCVAAFVLILVILSGNRLDDTSGRAIGTAVALAFLSLTAIAGSHLRFRQPQLSLFGVVTIAVSMLAFLVVAAAIWSEDHWKPAGICLVTAFACGHSSVLLSGIGDRDEDAIRLVRGGTIIALWLFALLLVGELLEAGDNVSPQGIGVLAVLYALGTLVLPLLRRSTPKPRRHEDLEIDHVVVGAGDRERSDRFYGQGLGAGIRTGSEGKICFVWPGTAESAVNHLRACGIEIVAGPQIKTGTHGAGVSVCCRDPSGNLVELISYS